MCIRRVECHQRNLGGTKFLGFISNCNRFKKLSTLSANIYLNIWTLIFLFIFQWFGSQQRCFHVTGRVCVLVILVLTISTLTFSASSMGMTRLRLFVWLVSLHVCMCVFTCFLHMWLESPGRHGATKVNFNSHHQSPLLSFPGSFHLLPSPCHVRLTNQSALISASSFLISPLFFVLFPPFNNTQSFLCSSLCGKHAKSACSKWAWAGFYDPFWHHGVPLVQGKFWCASLLPTCA